MDKYKPIMLKEDKRIKEQIENEDVKGIIEILKDENFGNENQRKKFIDLMTSLFNIADKDARLFIKKLGNACTDIGAEMLEDDVEEIADSLDINEISDELASEEINTSDEDIVEEEDMVESTKYKYKSEAYKPIFKKEEDIK